VTFPPRPELIATLMTFVAATLAAMSSLHLSGILTGTADPFDPTHAGTAEAVICVALAVAAAALVRRWPHARAIAIAAVGFAVVGFVVGLNFTIRGGGTLEIAYHVTVLPLLLLTATALLLDRRPDRQPARVSRGG
jgi:peptidoglycan/LPS O-acetylase OafA/YrhL